MSIMEKMMKEHYRNIIQTLNDETNRVLVYGAQLVATEVAQCLIETPYNCCIEAFVVSSLNNNPKSLLGIKVIDLDELVKRYSVKQLIVIATMDKYLDEIRLALNERGFNNILPLTFESDEWSMVQDNYLQVYCKNEKKQYKKHVASDSHIDLYDNGLVHIYSVRSIYDKKLTEQYEVDWEIPIQVGTSLTDMRICKIQDNEGDNISEKNKQYCELTALYWIWKHDKSKYKGMGHYRRHFCLSKKDLLRLSNIDILVTVPILNFPNVKSVYCHDHLKDDWDVMVEAVKKMAPKYECALRRLENSRYYYAYNMFIAKEEVFNHYCEWLFPILFYCEENGPVHDSLYQNRYIGFLAERLLTVYLFYHEEDYKIEIVDKHFVR